MEKFKSPVSFLSILNQNGMQLLRNETLSTLVTLHLKDYQRKYCDCSDCNGSIIDVMEKETDFAGQIHAEYLLQNQEIIPEEWREFALIFLGTIWEKRQYGRCVPCLLPVPLKNWRLDLIYCRDVPYSRMRVVHFKERNDFELDQRVKLITILPEDYSDPSA